MHRTRLSLSLAGVLALAACTADSPDVLTPLTSTGSSRAVTASPSGRYIVLANGGGFGAGFGASVAALGGSVERQHDGAGIAVVTNVTDPSALTTLAGVSDVQPDADVALDTQQATIEADATDVGAPAITSVSNPTTAARYPFQWNMRAIGAPAAWAAGKLGSAAVTVAIIDTGIDYDAPDLNGLVDLGRSVSLVASDNAISSTYFPTRHRISDYNGHGTNVATQVSSKAVALAGVTSKTTLIGVKVLAAGGSGSLSNVLGGVLWAADHGANVANMSLGGGFTKAGNGRYVSLIHRTFNYAAQKGMLVVVSAGNDAADLDHDGNMLPTYCAEPQVLCVSSTGPVTPTGNQDLPAYYTNFGRSAISVAGPGGNAGSVVSSWPYGAGTASYVWSYCSKTRIAGFTSAGVPVLTACTAGNRLSGFIGTSQASPHVSGLAALLVDKLGAGHASQVRNAIMQSADDLGQPGTDPMYGRGRINVAKAMGL